MNHKSKFQCPSCGGSGYASPADISERTAVSTQCPYCAGTGYVIMQADEERPIDKPWLNWKGVWNAVWGTALICLLLISIYAAMTTDWSRAIYNIIFALALIQSKILSNQYR